MIFLCVSYMTYASEAELYLGTGIGIGHFHGLNKIGGVNSGSEDISALNMFIGYKLNNYLSLEGGYQYLGDGKTDNFTFNNQGALVSLNSYIPIIDNLSLLSEFGGYWSHTRGLDSRDTKISTIMGVGLSYKINDKLDIRTRWRYIKDFSDINSSKYHYYFKPDESLATFEFVYYPFLSSKRNFNSYNENKKNPIVEARNAHQVFTTENDFELNGIVYFGFNKTALDAQATNSLDRLLKQLSSISGKNDVEIRVIGYSDSLGSESIKDRIAKSRAEIVSDYISLKNITESKVRVQTRDTPKNKHCEIKEISEKISCLSSDRRVEVKIVGRQKIEELSPW
ncbi:outer membrane beta-barrel protein [Vibrio cholerae]|uniref:outer membrane beta-barrel protein n=1 Tax=Vibrio cholerae TaxID=666 RepID=UPI0029346756|nr:outer membrane beta-barrel protein [Vibrio cholerae]MDV2307614.1 outer membrane beta-barrel protein [Vibrio cholerae]